MSLSDSYYHTKMTSLIFNSLPPINRTGRKKDFAVKKFLKYTMSHFGEPLIKIIALYSQEKIERKKKCFS